MVRRRSASPKPSAPVYKSSSTRPAKPPTIGSRNTYAPNSVSSAHSGSGGFMSQLAATAGGVAIGSVVGHSVSNMLSGSEEKREIEPASTYQNLNSQQQLSKPCEFEWQQFMECAKNQNDLSFCQSFNDILKQCQNRSASNY